LDVGLVRVDHGPDLTIDVGVDVVHELTSHVDLHLEVLIANRCCSVESND